MNQFANDIIQYIADYLVKNSEKCTLFMEDKTRQEYHNILLVNKHMNDAINRKCNINHIYKPKFKILPILCECNNHCDAQKNKIDIINQLNYLKLNNDKKIIRELKFKNNQESVHALPYVREIVDMAYLSKHKSSIYLLKSRKRFSGFF